MMKLKNQISAGLVCLLLSSCLSQLEIFDAEAPIDESPHIGNFYSTTIFEDHINDEVWFSKEPGCLDVKSQSDKVYSGEGALHIVWDKGAGGCDWLGIGFGWDGWSGKNMGSIYDRAAIRFRVRTDGKPLKNLPIALALEDYGELGAWVGFSRKMIKGEEIGSEWTDIVIPVLAFNWKEFDADISNIKQMMIQFEASGDIYLDDIQVIEYDGSLRSRGAIVMVEEKPVGARASIDELPSEAVFSIDDQRVAITMDDQHLYLTADIKDESPMMNSKTGDDIWNGDALEIAFSTDVNAPLGRNYYQTTDRHFGIRVSDTPMVWDWRKHKELSGCDVKIERTGTGYALSAAIPLAVLEFESIEENSLYGLEIALDLGDDKGRNEQKRWNSPDVEGFHLNPSLWGEARIIDHRP